MNEQQLAQLALQFFQRVQLQGNEAEAFIAVKFWLQQKATPAQEAPAVEVTQ
jgi:hypothetical protein